MSRVSPVINAGPMVRAGFSDAPVSGPPNRIQPASVKPMAIAAMFPTLPYAAAWMTVLARKNVSTASMIIACTPLIFAAGTVWPRFATPGKMKRSSKAAIIAPANCAIQYTTARITSIWRLTSRPSVTAGLTCAPEMCPYVAMMATRISPCASAATITSAATGVVLLPRIVTAPAPTNTSINVPINSAIPSLIKPLSTLDSFKNASQCQRYRQRHDSAIVRDNLHLHFVEDTPRDNQPLNLAGPFANPHQSLIAVTTLHPKFLPVP